MGSHSAGFKFSISVEISQQAILCGNFGKELADEFEFQIRRWGIQAIIPIPLHRSKMRKRGYNQAELLAKQLSECMGIPMERMFYIGLRKPGL